MKKLLTFALFWLIILAVFNACLCYDESLVVSVRDVYSRLVDAEEKGADMREAALKLNRALQLIREAEEDPENASILLSEARMLIEEVNADIPSLILEGENRTFWKNVTVCFAGILIVVVGALAYRFGPKLFWEAWLKIRSKWVVEVLKGHMDRSDKR